jgi:hypothetical protein
MDFQVLTIDPSLCGPRGYLSELQLVRTYCLDLASQGEPRPVALMNRRQSGFPFGQSV